MSDTVEPPTPLPPANPGGKSPAQIAAMFTVISGLGVAVCTFTPVILLSSNGNLVQTLPLSSTGDGSLFVVAGFLIAAFGVARYLEDRNAFRQLSGLIGALVLYMIYLDWKEINEHAGQYTYGTGVTVGYGPAYVLVGIAALATIITSESATPPQPKKAWSRYKAALDRYAARWHSRTTQADRPDQISKPDPGGKPDRDDKPALASKIGSWGSKPDWSSKLGSGDGSDNTAVIQILAVLAVVGIVVLIAVIALDNTSTPPDTATTGSDYSYSMPAPVTPTPEPVAHTVESIPVVRGVYPTETEIDFLQAREASASSFANAKCNCDLSLLESNVSLQRMMAIESNTAAGQPLPDDVSAMFDSCKAATG